MLVEKGMIPPFPLSSYVKDLDSGYVFWSFMYLCIRKL